eukprot:COSAG06_NODE_6412_length_2944_cov_2.957118_2_plen_139_part_00
MLHRFLLLLLALLVADAHTAAAADPAHDDDGRTGGTPFSGHFVTGVASNANGTRFLELADAARRMFAAGDPEAELMTFSGVYDSAHFGATEGSIWSGNIWTQNSYGVGFASLPFLPQPQLQWLQTGFLWWSVCCVLFL